MKIDRAEALDKLAKLDADLIGTEKPSIKPESDGESVEKPADSKQTPQGIDEENTPQGSVDSRQCFYWSSISKGRSNYPYKEHWRDCDMCQKTDPGATDDQRQPTALDRRESIWTSSPPVEPGYYWWKQGERIEPCEVRDIGNGHLEAWFVGESDPLDQWQWQPDWMWADMPTPAEKGQSD